MKASAFFDQNYHYIITIVWFTSKLGCVGKFCIVAKPACQLLSANQTLIQVKDTKKALEEICEIRCDSDYCGTKEIDNQPDQ